MALFVFAKVVLMALGRLMKHLIVFVCSLLVYIGLLGIAGGLLLQLARPQSS